MFYDKKIKYLNYIVDDNRLKGCGFVKIELRDMILNMEVLVDGLPSAMLMVSKVWMCTSNDKYVLGEICLENGGGVFRLSGCRFKEICPVGISYEDWIGVVIVPDSGCEISAWWGEQSECVLERVREIAESEYVPKVIAEKPLMSESESAPKLEKDGFDKELADKMRLAEDKWEQLWQIYPHICPFQDKREYLSIRPADFVLLSAKSYKAVNNSFLLHGFYNYKHLILVKSIKRGDAMYYVGTPGNFFEKEKQVAMMFGFAGFESAKDPAREGDFGYYLMEVKM